MLATEPSVLKGRELAFSLVETSLGVVFAVEYVARFWTASDACRDRSAISARLRFVVSPTGLLDLVVVIATLVPTSIAAPVVLRLVRAARILRLANVGRTSQALRHVADALRSRRDELAVTAGLAAGVLVLSATALYWAESAVQPEQFGSIPRAMWWAVVTLTTIGYGDVYPVTALGRVLASVVAVAGIALVAMPTGILAAAFSDAMARRRATLEEGQDAPDQRNRRG